MAVILQVALDFVDLHRAVKVAQEAIEGGADWLEIGTPLIKSEGMNAIRHFRKLFPAVTLVADMKTMDAGRTEVEMAAKAGANIAVVMGHAPDSTIRECIEAGRNYGIKICVDFMNDSKIDEHITNIEKWGADYIAVHTAIDDQMHGETPFNMLQRIGSKVKIPIAVAGGINSENVLDTVNAGASVVIVGGYITKSKNAKVAAESIKNAIRENRRICTTLFKRVTPEEVRDALMKLSTANISDGSHRAEGITGLYPIYTNMKLLGNAVTVRTYPGDWAKPVEAIDIAKEGDIIVIDAGGTGPAVWGELATHSALQKKIRGVVIHGAMRDVAEIRKLNFPAFTKMVMPMAGEPKGFGEINVPIRISGIQINPGDWIIGDDDGLMVLPQSEADIMVNYGMDCLEKENRIREEIISEKSSLGKVIDVLKWEKR
ncbi:MAG: bifunctional hexulose-6-phosphate synthase/ribonuclease regulator [Candidatus Jettenia sp.]|uniref:3-hexulose-6-phosphate synthase n=1 Tax=Candidatus Jettenia caeni TaxID=247490 RepID=I3IJL0_9BACT|nr:3-hexulose-6-phosphate synthase [Candidatus Jettenia sp. AMX1]MBC6930305.1 bifunctional hexulose-6-phosphate synthase/ribonuclease regulator [Candidatus Jettenia sp.]NUN22347.1 orotidine 5'-phosphate decarboxylase [Candidatus Jettenia caeni]KAA0248829.1 MAG: bifunctional hexulose-6-phosphate synthase/ribonuclease regulator [Candidatus Jettenia sp. AMX1]MCE7881212.1 bifunctional hexulose-6-phosphate synthase/ribonuclease regulator [Candidatus Jettenia sp. AMX1]MCQ3927857.1 bifunctional hexul